MNKEIVDNITNWLKKLNYKDFTIEQASYDASFRSYFRVKHGNNSKIVMNSPPTEEPLTSFIAITKKLSDANINVPEIYEIDLEKGFMLISDFGSKTYLDVLNKETMYCLYTDAMDVIVNMQKGVDQTELNGFDANEQLIEMSLFRDWFLDRHLNINITDTQHAELDNIFRALSNEILKIPTSFVHRDFHSRNLMVLDKNNPGILDYQDALIGPITYDIVSLLKDCYIEWDDEIIDSMLKTFYERVTHHNYSYDEFKYWFNITGLQRHLKAIGIFARLKYRDNKSSYIKDIPRTFSYIDKVLKKNGEFSGMKDVFNEFNINEKL